MTKPALDARTFNPGKSYKRKRERKPKRRFKVVKKGVSRNSTQKMTNTYSSGLEKTIQDLCYSMAIVVGTSRFLLGYARIW